MSNPLSDDVTLHAVLKVKSVSYSPYDALWRVTFHTYGGSMFDLILYTNGNQDCPFRRGDFYQTDAGKRGGWHLTRLPQEEIDQIKGVTKNAISNPSY